jgi:hypothetical protein
MTVLAARSESPVGSITIRRRDRRQALGDVLLAVTRAIDRREDVWTMRVAFEDALSRALPVRTAQLRDPSSRWSARGALTHGAESIALDVPGSEPAGPGVLEATFDPGCALAEWELQMLGLATHVGGLILEIERLRAQLARLGLLTAGRQRRDGAAPLIGSTPAMQALRRTIERVSATDFTVLLEGPSDPQQKAKHRGFL